MSQCVPRWDLHDNSFPFHVPSLDHCEVAEMTWQDGQLALHGLGNKPRAAVAVAGTLEAIVNQAAFHFHADPKSADANELAPWFDHRRGVPGAAVTMDALVPVREHAPDPVPEIGGESTRVGSCSGATVPGCGPAGIYGCKRNASVSESTVRDDRQLTLTTSTFDTCEGGYGGGGCTSTTVWSQEDISSGKEYATTTSVADPDSFCHSTPQKETIGKPSAKRSRAAAVHSQSERRRRDRINQRMKTLQKMVPNSSKTDKASMLDEVIEYVKQLQAQLHVMSMYMSQTMMLQQYIYMSMMGRTMGMPLIVSPAAIGMPPIISGSTAFMPMAPWNIQGNRLPSPEFLSTLLASALQPMGIDGYGRLAAFYQHFQQPFGSKNN